MCRFCWRRIVIVLIGGVRAVMGDALRLGAKDGGL